jgi:S-adenosylmethionine:tRNA ribosyltransferase-isomerase
VAAIERARHRKGKIVAVGTTVVRALESAASVPGAIRPYRGETSLFILPGYRFRIVEALVTNFHLPQTTLLMLVAAFAGTHALREAYEEAVRERYRFYSYGDAMLVADRDAASGGG